MARPIKDYRVQQNGNSLQVFKAGKLGGSISIRALYVLVSDEELKHTTMVNIQEYLLKKGGQDGG